MPPTSPPTAACCYLRSSKDRHDLSIDAQRRSLHDYARAQGLALVAEYTDAVESGKDDDRPGFQILLRALKDPARPWRVILVIDTSRIARRRHLALIFEHEAEKVGVRIQYQSVPDADPITAMLLRSILQAMDEYHSMVSKAKGLAGMAEAIKQGWRAGGQAPRGYCLDHQATATLRDGQPVIRSKLTPGPDAPQVTNYLKARAAGVSRPTACATSGLPPTSLNELEWQALTYAGHTVWNIHHEHRPGGYVGGNKRKPRGEWHIARDTHPALITEAEAERILAQLTARATPRQRQGARIYLLSGLLQDPQAQPYSGETTKGQAFYRLGKGPRIAAHIIDTAVLDRVFTDLTAPATARQLATALRAQVTPAITPAEITTLRRRLAALDTKIANLIDLQVANPAAATAYQRAIASQESARQTLAADLEHAITARQHAAPAAAWTTADVTRLLAGLRKELEQEIAEEHTAAVKQALAAVVEKIILDLTSRTWEIHYRLDTGVKMASPRDSHVTPVRWHSARLPLPRRAAA